METNNPSVVILGTALESSLRAKPNAEYLSTILKAEIVKWDDEARTVKLNTQSVLGENYEEFNFHYPRTIEQNTIKLAALAGKTEVDRNVILSVTKLRKFVKECVDEINAASGTTYRQLFFARNRQLRQNSNVSHPVKGNAYATIYLSKSSANLKQAEYDKCSKLMQAGAKLKDGERTETITVMDENGKNLTVFAQNDGLYNIVSVAFKSKGGNADLVDAAEFPFTYYLVK